MAPIILNTTVSITGCDSVLTINLTVNNPSSIIINSQLCTGESIHIGTNSTPQLVHIMIHY